MGTQHKHTDDWEYEFYRDTISDHENVVAVAYLNPFNGEYEGFTPTFYHDNSGVSWGGIPHQALGEKLTEKKAREIHPRLFERIDSANYV